MIQDFFDKTVVVRRLRDVSGTGKRSLQATATVDGAIQELDREARLAGGFVEERAWIAYFDIEATLQEGDLITDARGVQYKLIEITRKDYGINQHLEVIMVEHNA